MAPAIVVGGRGTRQAIHALVGTSEADLRLLQRAQTEVLDAGASARYAVVMGDFLDSDDLTCVFMPSHRVVALVPAVNTPACVCQGMSRCST